jgi:ubiquinone biosynthesis protein COQ4
MNAEREAMDAYLSKNVRRSASDSPLLASSSRWLNNGVVREVLATWLLRKNSPDFPVEADHTLGLSTAMASVQPPSEVEALIAHERTINPRFDAFFQERFVSKFENADFDRFEPGTVGGIIGRQIRDFGFDLTLGIRDNTAPEKDYDYWRLRGRQTHDFEHIVTGGGFDSIGEVVVIFARCANHSAHLSPKLASAFNAYLLFAGLRMVTRSLLHYPETWMKVLEAMEQGVKVGRASDPIWAYRFEDVFTLTPQAARAALGVREAYDVDSRAESAIFREEPVSLAEAAE